MKRKAQRKNTRKNRQEGHKNNGGLTLREETLRKLSDDELSDVAGGDGWITLQEPPG